jgi:8-oxo-dGTP pyrophosphatase MutT (NUDIX family)
VTPQSGRPRVTAADGRRTIAHFPAAVLVYVVDDDGRLLLLSEDRVAWEVVSGALESDETVVDGALREAREELGDAVRLRPLGTVHVSTVHYDSRIRDMIDIGYLFAYEGGAIEPGDDAAGFVYRWWTLEELSSGKVRVSTPQGHEWLFARAVELYRLWREQDRPLQDRPPIELDRL